MTRTITSMTIYFDDSDPGNAGWAWSVTYVGAVHCGHGLSGSLPHSGRYCGLTTLRRSLARECGSGVLVGMKFPATARSNNGWRFVEHGFLGWEWTE